MTEMIERVDVWAEMIQHAARQSLATGLPVVFRHPITGEATAAFFPPSGRPATQAELAALSHPTPPQEEEKG